MDYFDDIPIDLSVNVSNVDNQVLLHFDADVNDLMMQNVLLQLSKLFEKFSFCGFVNNRDNSILDDDNKCKSLISECDALAVVLNEMTFLREPALSVCRLARLTPHCCCCGIGADDDDDDDGYDDNDDNVESSSLMSTTTTRCVEAHCRCCVANAENLVSSPVSVGKRCAKSKYDPIYATLANIIASDGAMPGPRSIDALYRGAGTVANHSNSSNSSTTTTSKVQTLRCAFEQCFVPELVERERAREDDGRTSMRIGLRWRCDSTWLDALNARVVRASAGRRAVTCPAVRRRPPAFRSSPFAAATTTTTAGTAAFAGSSSSPFSQQYASPFASPASVSPALFAAPPPLLSPDESSSILKYSQSTELLVVEIRDGATSRAAPATRVVYKILVAPALSGFGESPVQAQAVAAPTNASSNSASQRKSRKNKSQSANNSARTKTRRKAGNKANNNNDSNSTGFCTIQ